MPFVAYMYQLAAGDMRGEGRGRGAHVFTPLSSSTVAVPRWQSRAAAVAERGDVALVIAPLAGRKP